MSKRKDHIWVSRDLVRSVLLGTPIKSKCGIEKTFTRDDLERMKYSDGCRNCIARLSDAVAPDPMVVHPKGGWTVLLERTWKELYFESIAPKFTFQVTSQQSYAWPDPEPKGGDAS